MDILVSRYGRGNGMLAWLIVNLSLAELLKPICKAIAPTVCLSLAQWWQSAWKRQRNEPCYFLLFKPLYFMFSNCLQNLVMNCSKNASLS
ncbi:hypothetical protein [Fischerella thermalis]|jgi:hypothetical protein|uniref:Uncharacterized protein n=1 Tax=Fischerella thermalis JSC-11 TaxID=741277 RepID=G6FXU4_9CYAN|nr:hypothetical protein [Fischerella thermalis]PLZ44917.1 hypothetical protein CBP27_01195 [Fischerella thermalis WC542]PMB03048.1 hypothetical protein CI594_06535 [Fischerella thermalis CCMEE 5196]PMB06761.1 hypothetical protein CI592_10225 [Fischerella thermalis CCMEE 5328]PMB17504.1 hypothetical protein CEN45_22085 [Fischerella thermalis CCMEE 5198]EHC10156.1 hypothetical protein FJSC11DRAFT_3693 [Fischerella thermalis JSC-11]